MELILGLGFHFYQVTQLGGNLLFDMGADSTKHRNTEPYLGPIDVCFQLQRWTDPESMKTK